MTTDILAVSKEMVRGLLTHHSKAEMTYAYRFSNLKMEMAIESIAVLFSDLEREPPTGLIRFILFRTAERDKRGNITISKDELDIAIDDILKLLANSESGQCPRNKD